MKSSILSQGEIDALLHSNRSSSPSDGLINLFAAVANSTVRWMNGLSAESIELGGPYFERMEKSLDDSVAQKVYASAAEVAGQEILVTMSCSDAEFLGQLIATPSLRAVQMTSQAWVSEMGKLIGTPYVVYQAQEVDLGSFALQYEGLPTYLVRNFLLPAGHRLELCVIIQDLEKFERLVRHASQGVKPSSQGGASMGSKLLKGPTSPVTKAVFTPIGELPQLEEEQKINLLEDIDLLVTVELGHTTLTLNEILELKKQSVIRLERHAGEPVDVYINNNRTAKGEVVVLEENFGVRILEILPKSQRLRE